MAKCTEGLVSHRKLNEILTHVDKFHRFSEKGIFYRLYCEIFDFNFILQNGLKDVFDEAILATFEPEDDGKRRICSLL